MAKEYKCVRCGKPAVIHITRISGNEKITLHFCEECAKKLAYENPDSPVSVIPEISKFEASAAKKEPEESCPTCGMQLADIKKGDKFCCPDCYSIADASVMDMLKQMHGATRHTGKRPKVHGANVDISKALKGDADVLGEELLSELDAAVSSSLASVSEALANASLEGAPDSPKGGIAPNPEKGEDAGASAPKTRAELQSMLDEAVRQERYEDAAKLRDKINSLPNT